MNRYEPGMLAISQAGHDKGQVYVIIKVEHEIVYLSDGRLKPLDHPKKKNTRHIQVIRTVAEELAAIGNRDHGSVRNEDIRNVIRRFGHV